MDKINQKVLENFILTILNYLFRISNIAKKRKSIKLFIRFWGFLKLLSSGNNKNSFAHLYYKKEIMYGY